MRTGFIEKLRRPATVFVAFMVIYALSRLAPTDAPAQGPFPLPALQAIKQRPPQPAEKRPAEKPAAPDSSEAKAAVPVPAVSDTAISTETDKARRLAKDADAWPEWAAMLKDLAKQNLGLSKQLSRARKEQKKESVLLRTQDREMEELEKTFESLQTRINRMGLTTSSGQILQTLRGALVAYEPDQADIVALRKGMIDLIDTEQQLLSEQVSYGRLSRTLVKRDLADVLSTLTPTEKKVLKANAKALLENRCALLDQLFAANEARRNELNRRLLLQDRMETVREKFRDFIMEMLFWTRITSVYDWGDDKRPSDLSKGIQAFHWLTSPEKWAGIPVDLWHSLARDAFQWLLVTVLAIMLVTARPRIDRRMADLNRNVGKSRVDSLFVTVRALLLAAVRSAGLPVLLLCCAKLLGDPPTTPIFTRVFCSGVYSVSIVLAFVALAYEFTREGGVGHVHFQWGKSSHKAFNRGNLFLLLIFLFLFFLYVMIQRGVQGQGFQGSLGRLLFCLAMAPLFVLVFRLFREGGPLRKSLLELGPTHLLNRLQKPIAIVIVLVPVALTLLTIAGYWYTANVLIIDIFYTFFALLCVAVMHATLMRWITVGNRRLAYEKAVQEWKAAAAKAVVRPAGEADNEAALRDTIKLPEEPDEANLAVQRISEQARFLAQAVTAIVGAVFLWLIWSEVFQALGMLDSVRLYDTQDGVGPDGKPLIRPITLAGILASAAIFAATVILARTIPSVLQMLRIKRFTADPGSLLAFGQIARYVILLVGIGLVMGRLGLSWSKFSVVAAAMTLGLSWGLQDIFSNFVSGIILLLERPVRVGDIVTVAGVTGKVSSIRIRATSIVNWDRQETIVPNKSFLSEKVTNWSRSDEITRVVIDVGISYDNDTERAQALLLAIAQQNPLVKDDPAPSVVFDGFGADALAFKLRVFVRLDDMIAVQNQLRHTIRKEFVKEGIQMPFSQMDVHMDEERPIKVRLVEKPS